MAFSWFEFDDGRDYTAVIVAQMNGLCVRGQNLAAYTGSVKPAGVRKPIQKREKVTCAKVGKRRRYSRNVMTGVYQLHRLNVNEERIGALLDIPVGDIKKLLKHNTETQAYQWRIVMRQPEEKIPDVETIVNRLANELPLEMTVSQKDK